MGGGARLLSFLKLSFLYIGAIDFVNIRIQPLTESLEIAVRKLNDMRQGSKSFSVFISSFEKTMLETGSLNWDE